MRNFQLLLIVLLFAGCLSAADWPGFRNDLQRTGKSTETGLLTSWPAGGPEMLWSIEGELGLGWSGCAVVDDIIYTAGMDKKTRVGILYAIDNKGNIIWQKEYGQEWFKSFKGARSTPAVVDGKVYIMTGNGLVSCFDAKDGKPNWQVDVAEKYGTKSPTFGQAESVLVVDGKVICTPGGSEASLVALNAADGKELWKVKSFGTNVSYCSAAYIKHNGQDMVVTLLSDMAFGVALADGELLWDLKYEVFEGKASGGGSDVRANTPQYFDGKLLMSAGYNRGAGVIKLADDCRSVEVLKYIKEFDNHHHGIVVNDGYAYGSCWWNTNDKGRWMCMDLDNYEIKYTHNWGTGKGVAIFAEGYLYCYNEKTGKVALVKADPSGFEISGSMFIEGSGEHWAHPSISNGRLYVRHGDSLFVYDIKAK